MEPIDLAPNHKWGLTATNPIWLAGGAIGYGEALLRELDTSALGGVVVGPIMRHSRAGPDPPRLAHVNGGCVLETGLQNRGVRRVLRHFAGRWAQLGCPVVAQIADTQPEDLRRVVQQLYAALGDGVAISGFELLLPRQADAQATRALVRSAVTHSDLPVWAKLPLQHAAALAPVAVEAGACGLVVGQPVTGMAHSVRQGAPVTGAVYGPLAFTWMMAALQAVAALNLPCALLACGGLHTLAQVQQVLATGADAVQIDSAVWIEPGLPAWLADALRDA